MKKNTKRFAVELEKPKNASDQDVKDYLEKAIKTECGCRDPEHDAMFYLNRNSVKIMKFVKRGRIACLPTFQQWFDENRSRLVDTSSQDAAEMMYNDLIMILTNGE